MSASAGETHRAGVRQTRHGVGPAPPITSATSAIHPGAAPAGGEHVRHWTAAHHDNVGQRRCRKDRGSLRPIGTAQDNKFLQGAALGAASAPGLGLLLGGGVARSPLGHLGSECNSAEGRLEILVYGSLKDNLMSGLPGGI